MPTVVSQSGGATILAHDLPTSGVLYMEAGLDMRAVPARLLPLVPLFCRSLTNMATQVRAPSLPLLRCQIWQLEYGAGRVMSLEVEACVLN